SHLRGERRATIRDVRSAMGYIITADRGCEDIHADIRQGLSPMVDADRLYFSLAVDGTGSPDLLLQDWSTLDPKDLVLPDVERVLQRVGGGGWKEVGIGPAVVGDR